MTQSGHVFLTLALVGALSFSASAQEAAPANFALGVPPPIPNTREIFALRAQSSSAAKAANLAALASSLSVNLSSRANSRAFYLNNYLASENVAMGWTGDLSGTPAQRVSGTAGTTSGAYKNATCLRINWFRAMAGLPSNVAFNSDYSANDQEAALMMTANQQLDHTPPSDWLLYSDNGATAAKNSNLALGWSGAEAITAYMLDYGPANDALGHRRWLLYPQTKTMGTGDIPWVGNFYSANAVWVLDGNFGTTRPATRDGFVAWPPPGYVPSPAIFPRWSFSYPEADFSAAKVTMTSPTGSVPVAVEPLHNPSYGENTLAWVWKGIDADTVYKAMSPPKQDTPYQVQIKGVKIGSKIRSFTYTVTVFDPKAADPVDQPDLAIATWGLTNWQGKNVYETVEQTSPFTSQMVSGKAKFKVKLQNDGNRKDTIALQGSAASNGFRIRYLDAGLDVTDAVVAGTYSVRLKPTLTRAIMVKIIAPVGAASRPVQSVTLVATSANDPAKTDAIWLAVFVP